MTTQYSRQLNISCLLTIRTGPFKNWLAHQF